MDYIECSEVGCGNPVFSRGLCRKHYERERLETAAPCSVSGCQNKAYRGNLCAEHYRKEQMRLRPACTVFGCEEPQKTLTSGLCNKHYFRFSRHGSVEQPRSADWGAKESHPLYQVYHWHRRKFDGMCEEWSQDFWVFVSAVSPRPDGHTLRKIDSKQPVGPNNWYWKESTPSADKAAYQKAWRNKNPEKAKNADLQKMFGIGLKTYTAMSEAQGHRCAICGEHESAVSKDGVPRRMPVDHCHVTGKIRALLCSACNKALGGFRDSPSLLRKAAEYVEKHVDPSAPT
jgi:hypothetical protein